MISTFSTIQSSLILDAEILVGVQDIDDSDQEVLNWLSEQPATRIIQAKGSFNLSGNLNALIRESRSPLFVRMDDDDYMHPSRLKALKAEYSICKNSAIIGQAYKVFSQAQLSRLIIPPQGSIENKIQLLLGVPFAHPAITLNLDKIGPNPYDERQQYAQDYMLYVDTIEKGCFVGLPSIAIYYQQSNSINEANDAKRMEQLICHERAMLKIWSRIDKMKNHISPLTIHRLRTILVTTEHSSLKNFSKADQEECQQLLIQAQESLREDLLCQLEP